MLIRRASAVPNEQALDPVRYVGCSGGSTSNTWVVEGGALAMPQVRYVAWYVHYTQCPLQYAVPRGGWGGALGTRNYSGGRMQQAL
jgi:hypothetical protein